MRDKLVRPVKQICEQIWLFLLKYCSLLGIVNVLVMSTLLFITVAAIHPAHPYSASDTFPCTEFDKILKLS